MADRWAVATGSWSSTATWDGGTLPTSADDVYADGFTVTIDQDVTVLSIRNTQRTGGTTGGGFTLQAGRTVSATGSGFISSASTCITFSASGSPSVLNGNCTSGGAGSVVFHNGSSNTLTINGDISNPSFTGRTIDTNTNTTTIINGNILGGTAGDTIRTNGNALCVLTINGNVFGPPGGNGAVCVRLNGTSQTTIIGNVNAGNGFYSTSVFLEGPTPGPTLTITGNVVGNTVAGSTNSTGVSITANGGQSATVTINGNVTGGSISSPSSCIGLTTGLTGTATINGNVSAGLSSIGSTSCHGVTHGNTSTLIVTGNITSTISGVGVHGVSSATTIRHFGNLVSAPDGKMGIHGYFYFVNATNQQTFNPRVFSTNVERVLYTANAVPLSISPAVSDVRNGVVYASGEKTGTLVVPNPSYVSAGVLTDNTVGSLSYLSSTDLQAALSPNAPVAVQRTVDDTKAITFSWPVSGATITGQKSIDNGAYSAVSGAIAFLRTESNRHYYTLAYNANDRLTVEGTIRYKMTDGTYTKYFNLHLYDVTSDVTVYPTQLQQEDRAVEAPIKIYTGESGTQYFFAIDADQNPINLTGKNLELRFADTASKKTLYTAKTSNGSLSVTLVNKVTFTKSLIFTRYELSTLRFSLRDMSAGEEVLLAGPVKLVWAP